MSDTLARIVAAKRQEIASRMRRFPAPVLEERLREAPPARDFRAALESAQRPAIIAEVKKASPSAGVLRADFDPVGIARIYEANGAAAVSVLTDEPFFQGRLENLTAIRNAIALPLLRKDFILDPYQVVEARAAGADAVLLIAEILPGEELSRLLREIEHCGMQALVEIYEAENLPRVLDVGAKLIGINNRNLRTFETKLQHTLQMTERLRSARGAIGADARGVCLISESGIRTRADIELLKSANVTAVLIGETLMREADIGAKLRELRGE